MPTISFDSSCNLQCPDTSATDGSTISWNADSTVSSFSISNIVPETAFTTLPTSKNNWTAVLGSFTGSITYQVNAFPANVRSCGNLSKQKAPHISAIAPVPVK